MLKHEKEVREYNPVIWNLKKMSFSIKRYALNVFILAVTALFVLGLKKRAILPGEITDTIAIIGIIIACIVRIGFEWERIPILRFGKFSRTKGPGLFIAIPFIDHIVDYVDCRIIVTDFSAERVLTADAVPVYVDAIIFWMVWDAAKCRLEVENYKNAVALSAKTALRDIISKNQLSKILTDRAEIGRELQQILDAKTNPWGITSLSVEIKDIIIPETLEDSMSKEAQAEREKNARLILSEAEMELAERFTAAGEKYNANDTAVQLRSMNMLLEALKKQGSMILVPSEVPHLMNKAVSAAIAKHHKDV